MRSMLAAEASQLDTRELHLDLERCIEINRGKTASLFRWAAASGGSSLPSPAVHRRGAWGEHFGMAYQLATMSSIWRATVGDGQDAVHRSRGGQAPTRWWREAQATVRAAAIERRLHDPTGRTRRWQRRCATGYGARRNRRAQARARDHADRRAPRSHPCRGTRRARCSRAHEGHSSAPLRLRPSHPRGSCMGWPDRVRRSRSRADRSSTPISKLDRRAAHDAPRRRHRYDPGSPKEARPARCRRAITSVRTCATRRPTRTRLPRGKTLKGRCRVVTVSAVVGGTRSRDEAHGRGGHHEPAPAATHRGPGIECTRREVDATDRRAPDGRQAMHAPSTGSAGARVDRSAHARGLTMRRGGIVSPGRDRREASAERRAIAPCVAVVDERTNSCASAHCRVDAGESPRGRRGSPHRWCGVDGLRSPAETETDPRPERPRWRAGPWRRRLRDDALGHGGLGCGRVLRRRCRGIDRRERE